MKCLLIIPFCVILCAASVLASEMIDDASGGREGDGPSPDGLRPEPDSNVLTDAEKEYGFQLLFNGKDLSDWKTAENRGAFKVENGILVVKGSRGHLFYTGPVNGAGFTNFHFKAEVLTKPGANSGVYFHTRYQEKGWPTKGYEAQVNNTHKDKRKTGSLYAVKDNGKAVAKDDQWFLYEIIVQGRRITIRIDAKEIVTFEEPADHNVKGWPQRRLSSGTFAIQAHDPKSEVHYRGIKVTPWP